MKRCFSDDQIAEIMIRGTAASDFASLKKHIANCPKCHNIALQFAKLQGALGFIEQAPGGRIAVRSVSPPPGFVDRLKRATVARHHEIQTRKKHINRLIDGLLDAFSFRGVNPAVEPGLFGYAATAPGHRLRTKTAAELRARLRAEIESILEGLANPEKPLEHRLKIARLMRATLRRQISTRHRVKKAKRNRRQP